MNYKKFAKILKSERKKVNITQQELADRIGITRYAIMAWENGRKNITLENADKVLKALGVEIIIGGQQ